MNDKKLGGGLSACPKAARKTADVVVAVVRWFILLAIGYIVIYPLFYMITSSLSTRSSLLDPTSVWIPKELTLDNFKFMWEVMDYGKAFLSTVRVELVSALIEVLTCAIVAYGFARFRFPGKRLMTAALFLTILIPAPMIIIPLMMNFSHLDLFGILSLVKTLGGPDLRLNLLGTPWTFWLPSLFANGLRAGIMIYIYIQFFKGLPGELEEAAWMDGAGPIRTFFSIAVPSSSVVILTVTVFSIIWHWNDSFLATMYMDTDYPLSVTMSKLVELLTYKNVYLSPDRPEGLAYIMAACLMFILPPLVFYLIVQHWFVESIDRVGITG